MDFSFDGQKGFRNMAFIEGPLNRFDGLNLLVGTGWDSKLGKQKPLTQRKFTLLMRKGIGFAKQNQVREFAIDFKQVKALAPKELSEPKVAEIIATAFAMTAYEHRSYKTAPAAGFMQVEQVGVLNASAAAKNGFMRGNIIGESINAARELSNTPGGDMTPEILAEAAVEASRGTSAKVKILGRNEMTELGMGAILGIGKGSIHEPQFIIVEYWGAERTKAPTVLVGKGVTYDTGGLSIKTGDHMYEMHMDMSGGAAVIHAVLLAAKLGIKKNVIALVPAVENNLGSNAVRPGDILTSLSGKTIEILNTDAEGRVILADALTYAKKYNPAAVVDVATLTGASLVTLGTVASAFMSNKEAVHPKIMELAEESGDLMWPLPLWEEYNDMVKGTFGDVPNISTMGNSRFGGVIAGGKFLEVFAKDLNCFWMHIDMAPVMTSTPGDGLAKGAAGAPIRFLLSFIESGVK